VQKTSGLVLSDKGKLRVFISYSRDDLDFADQLDAALYDFECLIDRHGISGGEDWKRRLGNLISEADTVVFVLSPSSARSEICAWEVEEAARLNKRILPVVCRPLEGVNPPLRLRDLNYMFFYADPKVPGSGFGTGLANLVAALNSDFDWLREHTRYLQRAMEWDKGARPANRLLSGNDILEAKAWAARRPKGAPEPTALHLDFIRASEEEAEARLADQRKQLEAMAAAQAERETALNKAQEALRPRPQTQSIKALPSCQIGDSLTSSTRKWFSVHTGGSMFIFGSSLLVLRCATALKSSSLEVTSSWMSLAGYPANNVAFPRTRGPWPTPARDARSAGGARSGVQESRVPDRGPRHSGGFAASGRGRWPGWGIIASSGSWRCLPASRPASRRSRRAACSRGDANTCSIIDKFA
jgi:hypothetical protein